MSTQKEQVVALLKSIETGDSAPVASINPARYQQHNLAVADGLAGFGALLQQLPKGSARVNTVRAFQDGDFVFTHTEYDFFGPKIGFDVFRFERGQIVEHWDNLQVTPEKPNPSGRTMIDGATEATDHERTAANKRLVAEFVDDILVHGRMARLVGYYDGDRYLQHNPHVADGLSGLGRALEEMAQRGVAMKYDRVTTASSDTGAVGGGFTARANQSRKAPAPKRRTKFRCRWRAEPISHRRIDVANVRRPNLRVAPAVRNHLPLLRTPSSPS